jgi:hypothetical protein
MLGLAGGIDVERWMLSWLIWGEGKGYGRQLEASAEVRIGLRGNVGREISGSEMSGSEFARLGGGVGGI